MTNAIFETGNSSPHHNQIFRNEAGFPDDHKFAMMTESDASEAQQLHLDDMLRDEINQLGFTISTPTSSLELLSEYREKIDDSLPNLRKEESYELDDFLSTDRMIVSPDLKLPSSTPRKIDSIGVRSLPFSLLDTEDISLEGDTDNMLTPCSGELLSSVFLHDGEIHNKKISSFFCDNQNQIHQHLLPAKFRSDNQHDIFGGFSYHSDDTKYRHTVDDQSTSCNNTTIITTPSPSSLGSATANPPTMFCLPTTNLSAFKETNQLSEALPPRDHLFDDPMTVSVDDFYSSPPSWSLSEDPLQKEKEKGDHQQDKQPRLNLFLCEEDKKPTGKNTITNTSLPPVAHTNRQEEEEEEQTFILLNSSVEARHKATVSEFTNNVMNELVLVSFSDRDRRGNRTKTPLGFRGFACRHCRGLRGGRTGRYFPSSLKTLIDPKKTLHPIHKHLIQCKFCPNYVKEHLALSFKEHMLALDEAKQMGKRQHRVQRQYFRRIWETLHPKKI